MNFIVTNNARTACFFDKVLLYLLDQYVSFDGTKKLHLSGFYVILKAVRGNQSSNSQLREILQMLSLMPISIKPF